jgi:hypothetical protein
LLLKNQIYYRKVLPEEAILYIESFSFSGFGNKVIAVKQTRRSYYALVSPSGWARINRYAPRFSKSGRLASLGEGKVPWERFLKLQGNIIFLDEEGKNVYIRSFE